jgi:hypothetical protein
MPANKDPFVCSLSGGLPHEFLGLVQAGATQAIKIGEICYWNGTYWVPVSAVAHHRYPLAIAKEEQKAAGRSELTGSRYIRFYALHPDDVFEFEIDAARSLAVGDTFTLTASNSQKLTYSAGAFAVAVNVDFGHYPQEEDTTIQNQSYARVAFNPACSYWGWKMSQGMRSGRRVISVSANETLAEADMYNTLILFTGAATATLPAVKPGMDAIFVNTTGDDVNIDPNASDKFRLDGALLDDGDKLSNTTIGHWVQVLAESADGFVAIAPVGTWTDGS